MLGNIWTWSVSILEGVSSTGCESSGLEYSTARKSWVYNVPQDGLHRNQMRHRVDPRILILVQVAYRYHVIDHVIDVGVTGPGSCS